MDFFPLYNSIRIASISTITIFFIGIGSAYYIAKLPRWIKTCCDIVLTLPLVLPPTVIGFFILKTIGPKSIIGSWFLHTLHIQLIMHWYSAVIASVIVAFPLMYRTARAAFEHYNTDLSSVAKTLGLSNTTIFWRIMLPECKMGIMAGAVLAFARSLGEYGATSMVSGFTPGYTATISTTVYQLWRTGNDGEAFWWAGINLIISALVLSLINILEKKDDRNH